MSAQFTAPSFDSVMQDVTSVRRSGAGKLRQLEVPALRRVAVMLDLCDPDDTEPAALVEVLKRGVNDLGGGREQDAVEYLLGLSRGSSLWTLNRRRTSAAELFVVKTETFRKNYEPDLLAATCEAILRLCHSARLRTARAEMEKKRHPADSRLAVQWVERFEAYYRMWTPVYATAANLKAALDTYLEEPSDHLPWDPDSEQPYDPVMQARGYARSALYNYAQFQLELKRFMTSHGGLWLASDADTEQQIANAIYRIGWHNDLNDEDDSWLRRMLADSRHEETEHFWDVIQAFPQGLRIHDLWQSMVAKGIRVDGEEREQLQVRLAIQACQDYCRLVDEDWKRIADWYTSTTTLMARADGATLYESAVIRAVGPEAIHP